MSYTPGHDTAKFLSRQFKCPVCDGRGFYEASYSSDGHNIDVNHRYKCECCHHGKINALDYNRTMVSQFGPGKLA